MYTRTYQFGLEAVASKTLPHVFCAELCLIYGDYSANFNLNPTALCSYKINNQMLDSLK